MLMLPTGGGKTLIASHHDGHPEAGDLHRAPDWSWSTRPTRSSNRPELTTWGLSRPAIR